MSGDEVHSTVMLCLIAPLRIMVAVYLARHFHLFCVLKAICLPRGTYFVFRLVLPTRSRRF